MDLHKKDFNECSFDFHFNYCLLVWMCHSRTLNNKINKLHQRCLRLIYTDKTSTFQELLDKDNSVSIHMRNIQSLATEMYKEANNISPEIMKEVFNFCGEIGYDLKQKNIFRESLFNSVYNGTEKVFFLGPKIWEVIPKNIIKLGSLNSFTKEIKNWKPNNCPCGLCKTYAKCRVSGLKPFVTQFSNKLMKLAFRYFYHISLFSLLIYPILFKPT